MVGQSLLVSTSAFLCSTNVANKEAYLPYKYDDDGAGGNQLKKLVQIKTMGPNVVKT